MIYQLVMLMTDRLLRSLYCLYFDLRLFFLQIMIDIIACYHIANIFCNSKITYDHYYLLFKTNDNHLTMFEIGYSVIST